MSGNSADEVVPAVCALPRAPDLSGLTVVALNPRPPLADYRAALQLAEREAKMRLGEAMLLSWYDRDRDFESPQHASECHQGSAVPGYVDYGIHHGATLMLDIEQGRFVFFYLPVAP
ncbi:MAG: AF1514 family protein [Gammaproteobacteria bacterium]|nr:AF1514 family protein [Gammaproteobacteria bacterium]